MIRDLALGLGLVAVVEGLVLALAPGRLDQMLELLRATEPERLRLIGLLVVTAGIALLWVARA